MAHQTFIVVLIPAPLAGTAVVYPKSLFILQCVAAATFAFVSLILIVLVSLSCVTCSSLQSIEV